MIKSPTTGFIADINRVQAGQHINKNDPLISVLGKEKHEAIAFVSMKDIHAFELGAAAKFIAQNGEKLPVKFRVEEISLAAVEELPYPELASEFNGPIAAKIDRDNHLIPEEAIYRVRLTPLDEMEWQPVRTLGYAVIEGQQRSWLMSFWYVFTKTLIKESGF